MVKVIIGAEQVIGSGSGKGKDQLQVLAQSHDQSHDQTNGGNQQQGKSFSLQRCWEQVMWHAKQQQQMMW